MKYIIQKIKFYGLLLIISSAWKAKAQNHGTSFQDAKSKRKATWHCYYTSEKSFFDFDASRKPVGICVEIMSNYANYVKNKYGIVAVLEFEELRSNTEGNFNKIKQGGAGDFGIAFAYVTEQRKQRYILTRPLFSDITYFVTPNSVSEIKNDEEAAKINNFTSYCLKDSFIEQQFKRIENRYHLKFGYKYLTESELTVDRMREILQKDPKSLIYVQAADLASVSKGKVKPQTHKVLQFNLPSAFLLSDKNSWRDDFDLFLSSYVKDEEYKRMLVKYLGLATYKTLSFE
jgi:hypothetical protein